MKLLTKIPESIFPTDEYDIPMLSLEMQPMKIDMLWDAWGSVRRSYQYGVIHFYEDDWKFESVLKYPEKIVNKNPLAVVEPNYTTDINYPMAYLLGLTYSKRWLGRTWQSLGVPLWVDANFAPCQADILFLGVPCGYRYYATRMKSNNKELILNQYQMCCDRAKSKDINFVGIGGGKGIKEWAKKHNIIWMPTTMQRIKGEIGE